MQKGFFSEAVREKAFSPAWVNKGKIAADIGEGSGFITEAQKKIKEMFLDKNAKNMQRNDQK